MAFRDIAFPGRQNSAAAYHGPALGTEPALTGLGICYSFEYQTALSGLTFRIDDEEAAHEVRGAS